MRETKFPDLKDWALIDIFNERLGISQQPQ
jgi:hypothetical protein